MAFRLLCHKKPTEKPKSKSNQIESKVTEIMNTKFGPYFLFTEIGKKCAVKSDR